MNESSNLNVDSFINFCNRLSKFEQAAITELSTHVKTRTFPKGTYLLKRGEVCKYLFFLEEGLAKTFFYKDDKEFIMKFFPENTMFTVLDSYLMQRPSNFMIIALEDTTVTFIDHIIMEQLCKNHHSVETFFRKLVSLASLNMMKRISEMLEENATQRYKHFLSDNSQLLQRVSLGDLASYLGITQVSLSRIRAKK